MRLALHVRSATQTRHQPDGCSFPPRNSAQPVVGFRRTSFANLWRSASRASRGTVRCVRLLVDMQSPPFVDCAAPASVDVRPLLHEHHPPVMCMAVYIAADAPLPLIPWDETRRAFYVSELGKEDEPV